MAAERIVLQIDQIDHLVLITGAGASRELGREGHALPLMSDWCNEIILRLEQIESGVALAAGLHGGMTGEDFEEALGAFLRWQSGLPDTARFLPFGGPSPGSHESEQILRWLERCTTRGTQVIEVIHASLFDQFGEPAIDRNRAARAYESLLSTLAGGYGAISVATTNYDFSAELALQSLGYSPRVGRESDGFTTPRLHPQTLVGDAALPDVPVLHLHGAVGWYRSGDEILCEGIDQAYNRTLGQPALLLPDPNKDPAKAAGVSALWDEFDIALRRASHILVVGHSLHDATLVDRLKIASARSGVRVALSYYAPPLGESSDEEDRRAVEERDRVRETVDSASPIGMRFGPDLFIDTSDLRSWLDLPPLPPSLRPDDES